MTPPLCGIVGSSRAGKTRLAQQLVPELASCGLTVGYVKHAPHGAQIDREASDSWRLREAFATEAVVVAPDTVTYLTPADPGGPPLATVVARMRDSDVVLVEGFSGEPHPKIRVRAAGQPPREVADPVLLDLERDGAAWTPHDLDRACEVVLGIVRQRPGPQVSIVADGVAVPVHGFAAEVVASGVHGIAAALRGVDRPRTLTVTVRLDPEDAADS